MLKLLTARQMQACDRAAIEDYGIPEIVLMENAGVQVVEAMLEFFEEPSHRVAVCCGKGNNGGDGLVVARHLHNLGHDVTVYLFAERDALEGSPAANLAMVDAAGIPLVEVPDAEAWRARPPRLDEAGWIVDALFGTGISGGLRGHWAEVVDAINGAGAPVVAVDLPSGLQADTGEVAGRAVVADLTVTFAAAKPCHFLPPAEEHCGELGVADIGIPVAAVDGVEGALEVLGPGDAAALLPPRDPDSHKGSYGRVLVVAGSPGTTGAASLTGLGALRGGAGLVTVCTPRSVWPIVAAHLTEALVRPLDDDGEGGLGEGALDEILALLDGADVLALGPGLGTRPGTVETVRRLVARAPVAAVVDADGLNALGDDLTPLEGAAGPRVLTPHPGEMARLCGGGTSAVQGDRTGVACDLAQRTGATVILKGYRSVVAGSDGRTVLNATGNPGMATGGTGDVLTGLVAALLGQGLEPFEAAAVGAFVHGLAGDRAAADTGEIALVAGDLVDALPGTLAWLEELATAVPDGLVEPA